MIQFSLSHGNQFQLFKARKLAGSNWLQELKSVPNINCLLLLIIFIVDQPARSSPCWANHVFHTRCLVHQPAQIWNGAKDSPSCAERSSRGLSNYLLINYHGFLIFLFSFCSCIWSSLWSRLYLFGTLLPVLLLFCTMCFCVCGEGGRLSFETREREGWWGGDGFVHESSVSSPESEWQREKSERDAQRLPKKTVFLVGMPAEFRNHAITIWKDSLSLLPSHSRPHSPRLNALLSDWALRFFSCNSLLDQTQCVDSNMLLNCIRLARQHKAKNIKQKCACT